jgi:hypothetical protein
MMHDDVYIWEGNHGASGAKVIVGLYSSIRCIGCVAARI